MSARSTPLWEKYLTWQEVRTWHPCTSSLRLSSASSYLTGAYIYTSSNIDHRTEQNPGSDFGPGQIMWLIALASLLHCASAYDVDLNKLDGLAKARVEVRVTVFIRFIRESRLNYNDNGPRLFVDFLLWLNVWMDAFYLLNFRAGACVSLHPFTV